MAGSTLHAPPRDLARTDHVIWWTTTATVVLLATIAAAVSYRHLHTLAVRHGESSWSAALVPLSVDGMILAASMALLADSRRGKRGGILPWTLLIIGSLASVAANIAVAEPSLIGRAVAAWPAFALIGGMEMAFRLVRHSVSRRTTFCEAQSDGDPDHMDDPPAATFTTHPTRIRGRALQREAWQWALRHRAPDGSLPSGDLVAHAFARSARWGRHVKKAGMAGAYN
jgi:hypothetical protein